MHARGRDCGRRRRHTRSALSGALLGLVLHGGCAVSAVDGALTVVPEGAKAGEADADTSVEPDAQTGVRPYTPTSGMDAGTSSATPERDATTALGDGVRDAGPSDGGPSAAAPSAPPRGDASTTDGDADTDASLSASCAPGTWSGQLTGTVNLTPVINGDRFLADLTGALELTALAGSADGRLRVTGGKLTAQDTLGNPFLATVGAGDIDCSTHGFSGAPLTGGRYTRDGTTQNFTGTLGAASGSAAATAGMAGTWNVTTVTGTRDGGGGSYDLAPGSAP